MQQIMTSIIIRETVEIKKDILNQSDQSGKK
jgi:hypothetical protein